MLVVEVELWQTQITFRYSMAMVWQYIYFVLKRGGVREPHWHPNVAELDYCISGRAIMTIFSPSAGYDSFTMDPGEIAFVPQGYIHDIENAGD